MDHGQLRWSTAKSVSRATCCKQIAYHALGILGVFLQEHFGLPGVWKEQQVPLLRFAKDRNDKGFVDDASAGV
jgi:hypothetical protein